MKIDDSIKKAAGLGVNTPAARTGKSAEKPAVDSKPGDSVHISSQLQTIAGQLASGSVFDSEKVEEIKAAIANGQFQVNAEKVAEGLIDTVKDLIHSRKG
ncbi:flagellar biosynthesis anti-sigma factor FlgM [Oxalobacteraceae bacterium R-40]|uniref:Negative regulator of flagellin synthesis n=1 Tax=Keguizhuia sedimenti TaxID=3064264 RepID=A0ABU1BPB8_9BURK|nr:flagellar biosynthesis anti-sigma factor FlgM [Oxalobacteraceae bacterium R-40]